MPTYWNGGDIPVDVQLFDAVSATMPDGSVVVRAVAQPVVTIMPGDSAALTQNVDGNVLQLVPDPIPASAVTVVAAPPTVAPGGPTP